MDFGEAIKAVDNGKMAAREGWNGKGMFIFKRTPKDIHILSIIIDESIPESVREFYRQDTIDENGVEYESFNDEDVVKVTPFLCLKAADGTIVNGWLASQTDILANDWVILNSSGNQESVQ